MTKTYDAIAPEKIQILYDETIRLQHRLSSMKEPCLIESGEWSSYKFCMERAFGCMHYKIVKILKEELANVQSFAEQLQFLEGLSAFLRDEIQEAQYG